jgi:phenol 2-monooxygenase
VFPLKADKQVGQRVADAFAKYDRIFLAGDAVHTHSPKAGQGMNISMHDSYNLVWKIASVIKMKARPLILSTYATERRAVALQLIAFNRRFSRMFSGRPVKDIADEAGISMEEFKRTFEKGNIFTSGISAKYGTNVLVDSTGKPEVAFRMPFGGLQLGMRFPSSQVACQADATPTQLGDALKSDSLWMLIVFAGKVTRPSAKERLERLGRALSQPDSFLRRLQQEVTLEPVLIHASPRQHVELFDFPKAFYSKKDGQYDYYRVFADDATYHHGHGHAYSNYEIDKESGCAVITRPDQYVGWMGEVDDVKGMERYLSAILR